MPILLLAGFVLFLAILLLTWGRRGKSAKVAFSLICVTLVAQGFVGAIHAWGESGNLIWTVGWLSFATLFGVLIYVRWRRP